MISAGKPGGSFGIEKNTGRNRDIMRKYNQMRQFGTYAIPDRRFYLNLKGVL